MTFKKADPSINRRGRPPHPATLPKLRKLILDHLQEGVDRAYDIVRNGSDRDAITALGLLWAYRFGKPVNHADPDGELPLSQQPGAVIILPSNGFERPEDVCDDPEIIEQYTQEPRQLAPPKPEPKPDT